MVDWHGLLGGEGEVNEWVVLVFGRVRPAREAPRLSFKIPFAISTSDERERRCTHVVLLYSPKAGQLPEGVERCGREERGVAIHGSPLGRAASPRIYIRRVHDHVMCINTPYLIVSTYALHVVATRSDARRSTIATRSDTFVFPSAVQSRLNGE